MNSLPQLQFFLIDVDDPAPPNSTFQSWKENHSSKEMLMSLGISMGCLYACRDRSGAHRFGTRVWNLTDRPIDLQIRVGSLLKRAHTLKPGGSKRLKCKSIYKAYMPASGGKHSFYYDETCLPYVWIHDSMSDFSRMVKQQYISLEDLRDCSEIRIYRDHERGCILVQKKPRPDFC